MELRHITKTYPGVKALDDVSISFKKGEVHALMGENGAGKSTFIKTIAGAATAWRTSASSCTRARSSASRVWSAQAEPS